jgi:solute carrier family 45 protein 1/2/4
MGIGNIVGMFCGGIKLPSVFPFLGDSQFKVLCAIATISIAITTSISVLTVSERDASLEQDISDAEEGLIAIFKGLWRSIFRLPTQIMRVCQVQFLAWIGWFPFLFYTTTYIAEIYTDPFFEENPHMSKEEIDRLWEDGTRRGSVALLLFAIVTLTSSILLPFLVPPTFKIIETIEDRTVLTRSMSNSTPGLSRPSHTKSLLTRIQNKSAELLTHLQIPSLTLRKTWLYSHVVFAVLMWATLLARSVTLATILIALVGVPWAVTMWAPFALISAEISKRDAIRRGVIRPPPTTEGALLAANEDDAADQAGVVLGIHNVSVSAPQVIATLVGSLLFKWLQKPRGEPGDDSVAWFMRLGGLCAIAAAYWTMRVGEESTKGTERPTDPSTYN